MKLALGTALLSLAMTALAPLTAHADDASPTDKLLTQQNGYVGNPAGGARLRPSARKADAKAMMMPKSAAAALYPSPAGLNPPAGNAPRARDIYKSPY
ncbi:hypothetical protein [Caballeronia sp. INDeC2]|uniref:hypothetical protein n=1 Tax=Caballeronia sp. INDeC2 TaxID=2921747 RepID=UPI002028DB39|nr:hypothetical protein [Caballeronia sp. INDeC2]